MNVHRHVISSDNQNPFNYPPAIFCPDLASNVSLVFLLQTLLHPSRSFFQRTRFQFSSSACLHSRQTTLGLPRFWKCSTVQSSSLSLPLWFSIPSDSCPVRQLLLSTLAITSLPTFQFLIHNTSELSSSYIHIHLSTL